MHTVSAGDLLFEFRKDDAGATYVSAAISRSSWNKVGTTQAVHNSPVNDLGESREDIYTTIPEAHYVVLCSVIDIAATTLITIAQYDVSATNTITAFSG